VAATSLLQQEDLSKINEQGLQDMVFFLWSAVRRLGPRENPSLNGPCSFVKFS
jgi:hypothetical protein